LHEKHGWGVKIATLKKKKEIPDIADIPFILIEDLGLETLKKIEAKKAEAIVLMLSDKENLGICELLYEKIGTKEIIIRLNDREYFNRFHELGALIMDPSTAMVDLLDHFVRAPVATSLLLGMDERQDSEDFEVLDKQLHGVAIRDLRLPGDILILSVKRKGQVLVTHGYTRLRKKDIITSVGSVESLEKLRVIFGK
jgi:Trk K+ transport system NAD-binding subunit